MDTVLYKIKRDMTNVTNRRLPQPPEGTNF